MLLFSLRLVDLTELIYSQGKDERHIYMQEVPDTKQLPASAFDYDHILLTIMTITITSMQNSEDTHWAWYYSRPSTSAAFFEALRYNLTREKWCHSGAETIYLGVRTVDKAHIRFTPSPNLATSRFLGPGIRHRRYLVALEARPNYVLLFSSILPLEQSACQILPGGTLIWMCNQGNTRGGWEKSDSRANDLFNEPKWVGVKNIQELCSHGIIHCVPFSVYLGKSVVSVLYEVRD